MSTKKALEEILKESILLSQKLGEQRSYLKDYALNSLYKDLCRLKLVAKLLQIENEEFIQFLERALREIGESEGIQKLDVLSQLGIKVGYSRRVVKLGEGR